MREKTDDEQAVALLAGFLRSATAARLNRVPIAQAEIDERTEAVAAFKRTHPNLSVEVAHELDLAIESYGQ
jgi:hypothetical protein